MAVLKDLKCRACGQRQEEMVSSDLAVVGAWCEGCGRRTVHDVLCTGNKLKCYLTSFDGRNWEGDVQPMGVNASFQRQGGPMLVNEHGIPVTGQPVLERDGTTKTDKLMAGFHDRAAARKDRKRSDRLRRQGRAPIFIDQVKAR